MNGRNPDRYCFFYEIGDGRIRYFENQEDLDEYKRGLLRKTGKLKGLVVLFLGLSFLLVCILGFLTGCDVAMACDSYEDCIEKGKYYDNFNVGSLSIHGEQAYYRVRALEYKFDEISKKLDEAPEASK